MKRAIVWLRQDLRIQDNPALFYANKECDEVIAVFIADDNSESLNNLGSASKVWLYHSLKQLQKDFKQFGAQLIFEKGDALKQLENLSSEINATHLFWNRCYEPQQVKRDERIKSKLKEKLNVKSFKGSLLFEPWENLKKDQTPFRVFTPFWNSLKKLQHSCFTLDKLSNFKPAKQVIPSLDLKELELLPNDKVPSWDTKIMSHWDVGEKAAIEKLHNFLDNTVLDYKAARDFPAIKGTSFISPHLHFGEISPSQIFQIAKQYSDTNPGKDQAIESFLREVAWREFAYHLLFYFPETVDQPLNKKFENFAWLEDNENHLIAWQKGMTGIPIIDAGMRELWETGYMHNRVRMIVASFLTKNLLIHWKQGESWFRDTLIDADIANNIMGWQWVAGSGADAAPYFRIFNPILQSQKFDSKGEYIRRWVPEISSLDNKDIHLPSEEFLENCDYPKPIVDLKATRERALSRYQEIK